MTRPSNDYLSRNIFTFREMSYCPNVFCVHSEHPAEEEHTDAFGRKYRDGEPTDLTGYRAPPPSPRTIGGAPKEDPA